MSRFLVRYCQVCGWTRSHKQTMIGGTLVYQCLTCHADIDTMQDTIKALYDSKMKNAKWNRRLTE